MTQSVHQLLSKPLDPSTVPLDGINLIEASAGTGKTYNITALFLRALLAFREEAAELAIPNVLVVTFTDAATQELRERIRSRLREAIHALEQGQSQPGDQFLQNLLASRSKDDYADLATYLNLQLRRFDEASIFTIHGFCQRILQENSFATGSLFDLELMQDDSGLIRDAVDDVWRQRLHEMDADLAAYLASKNITPTRLAKEAKLVLSKPRSQKYPLLLPSRSAASTAQVRAGYAALRQSWQACHAQLRAQLLEAQSAYAKNRVLGRRPESLFLPAHQFFSLADFSFNTHDLEALKYFRITEVAKVKKGQTAPEDVHGFFQQCEDFLVMVEDHKAALDLRLQQFKHEFFEATAECLRELKQLRQLRSFDDLLNDVANALQTNPALGAQLQQRYPIALIDEFQDTDPIQYEIFETIYQPRGGTLFMIGDPKQAIYGFRGGDIFTYIAASKQIDPGRAYTLGENHRSVSGLVEAVNHLFADRDGVPTFGHPEIPFLPVVAKGQCAGHLTLLDDKPLAPMRLLAVLDGPLKAGAARQFIAAQTAHKIAYLLNQSQAQRLRLHDRPLLPADIAVLVRTHQEGRLMREALAACGVRSVEYSQDSLFDSDEARELEAVLRAIVEPASRDALPTALATTMLGQTARVVYEVREGGALWEIWFQRFSYLQELWRTQGIAVMLQQLLYTTLDDSGSIAEAIVTTAGGERRITNLLHLTEVLQEVSTQERLTGASLVKWLSRQRDPDLRIGEAHELRLESDEELVKILTIHKSKGLQFPVVFCPFLWDVRAAASAPFSFHTEDGLAGIELGSRNLPDYAEDYNRHQRLAKAEADQEEMRLLYVALTRAQYLCYIAFGAIGGNSKPADSAKSILARLLRMQPDDYDGNEALVAGLERLSDAQPDIFAVRRLPLQPARFQAERQQTPLEALAFNRRIYSRWSRTSYSMLSQGWSERLLRTDDDDATTVVETAPDTDDFFSFTRGRQAGSFLHALLESIDFCAIDNDLLQAEIQRLAPRYGIDAERWSVVLQDAIARLVATPLGVDQLTLSAISAQDRLPELEFHFALHGGRGDLLAYLQRSGVASDAWEPALRLLAQGPPEGLMTGFIDLTFRFKNQYYLLDYKSNYLGNTYADYEQAKIVDVMARHAFNLQYLIYALALHRYLKTRLSGYQYGRDVGGVYYLFLRGMHPEQPGCGIFFDKPPEDLILALDRYFLGEPAHA